MDEGSAVHEGSGHDSWWFGVGGGGMPRHES